MLPRLVACDHFSPVHFIPHHGVHPRAAPVTSSNIFLGFLLAVLMGSPFYMSWYHRRVLYVVDQWSKTQGLKVISCRRVWFVPWKFIWTSSRSKVFMRVRVWDSSAKQEREGLVRVGSYLWGIWGGVECEPFWD